MPPKKKSKAQSRPLFSDWETNPENLAAFVDYVRSIGLAPAASTTDAEQGFEVRPAKRAKLSRGVFKPSDAVCIDEHTVALPARETAAVPKDFAILEQNIGDYVDVWVVNTKPDRNGPESGTWYLHLAPGKNSSHSNTNKSAHICYLLKTRTISRRLSLMTRVAKTHSFDPGSKGYVWTAVDIAIRQEGAFARINVTLRLMWNTSTDVYQSKVQQGLKSHVLLVYYPHLLPPSQEPVSWSPQDFYEAAHTPKPNLADERFAAPTIPNLEANLFPFQQRAVQWLLQREGVKWSGALQPDGQPLVQPSESGDASLLPAFFQQVRNPNGDMFHISPLFGIAVKDMTKLQHNDMVKGGILAEEMGPTLAYDPFLGRELLTTGATLIITPLPLLDQWLSELNRHAPSLKVVYYPGLKKAAKMKGVDLSVKQLAQQDVVITTYEVLRTEIWSAVDRPERSMRGEKQYERQTSPLVELGWWRVCIDEAQMVENWTSNTAVLARRIPRIHAWAITGTPVKDEIQKDLRGLLNFLRVEPYASDKDAWKALMFDKERFKRLFGCITMRHTKSMVRGEISIPPQKRHVITMPFSAVEEQHYRTVFGELVNNCGLDVEGNPIQEDWDPEDPAIQQSMRTALDCLRQLTLHPEVGNRNRRALGKKTGRPMRTVAEVLDAMLEQSDGAIRSDQRSLLLMQLKRGQILAGMDRLQDALNIWEDVHAKSTDMVAECRKNLEAELSKTPVVSPGAGEESESDDDEDTVSGAKDARRRLRNALEVQHMAVFLCANGYYSIKSDVQLTVPDSDEFKRLDKLESEGYDLAKVIRKEILQESYGKARKLMDKLEECREKQDFAVIPAVNIPKESGVECSNIVIALEGIYEALDKQAEKLDEWREHVIQLLLKPLVDEDNTDVEATGQEYEESTKLQDEILAYVQVLKAAIADRQAVISAQRNGLIEHEVGVMLNMARGDMEVEEGQEPPESAKRILELFAFRQSIKPKFTEGDGHTSLKGIISKLRALMTDLRHQEASGSKRARLELALAEKLFKSTQAQHADQGKAAAAMEIEVEKFTDILNARLDFYRQLQQVSDSVEEYTGATNEEALQRAINEEERLKTKVATAQSKHRYLLHLKKKDASSEEERMCVICQCSFSIGVLTVCGHQFCKECISMWFAAHHNCPVCKRALNRSNLHDITYKPQELKVHSEGHNKQLVQRGQLTSQPTSPSKSKKHSAIYTEFNPSKLAEIQNIDLENGPHYTTKVDTLLRHLLWLRQSDLGAKSIVFSQYSDFLHVLAQAFERYRIGYSSFDQGAISSVASFRDDPSIEVFLLHARAHASGLNLVNASHVFLCEPLLNTALELQAIARVDRIGQKQETTVWLYIVDGTVEQNVYELSVKRRLEHMERRNTSSSSTTKAKGTKGKGKESDSEMISLDAANAQEMQQAHLSRLMGKGSDGVVGEAVDQNDLWTCLFGGVKPAAGQPPTTGGTGGSGRGNDADEERELVENPVTRGFLAGEAAEERSRGREGGEASG
ncbi:SNF2 family N-terminal domain-containing protein [Pseudoneurospora amorphoporcata]|uniref:SNF2 family N-terminal domain-containing protein n=1 Tax=Pseudoneurospora amorphoporcata TaxID=241081 RepID=A0AAN6P2F2_9PEZI|nr:SNF2 family N-terminal domain-containing protein [Pseudoneurospora amorphoporcata]